MKAFALSAFLALGFSVPSCAHKPLPPVEVTPAPAPAAAEKGKADEKKQSKAAAAVESAAAANERNPQGAPQDAVKRELAVAASLLPAPAPEDREEARLRREAVLTGKLEEAAALYARTEASVRELLSRIEQLEKMRVEQEKAAAEAIRREIRTRDDEIARLRNEAASKERFWRTMILTGLGALLIVGAILSAALRTQIPAFGPMVTVGLGFAGVCLIILNVLASQLEKQLEAHPWILWAGCGIAGVAVIGALGLMVSNHLHGSSEKNLHQ